MTPAFTSLTTVVDSSTLSSTSSHSNIPYYTQYPRYSSEVPISSTKLLNRILINDLNSLVDNIQNHQQRRDLLSLLFRFYNIFDTTRHNFARTPIPHVINTIPHSALASRPYSQPDREEATHRLIQEFLEADLISESNSPSQENKSDNGSDQPTKSDGIRETNLLTDPTDQHYFLFTC